MTVRLAVLLKRAVLVYFGWSCCADKETTIPFCLGVAVAGVGWVVKIELIGTENVAWHRNKLLDPCMLSYV